MFLLQVLINFLCGISVRTHLKQRINERCCCFVYFQLMIYYFIAKRNRAAIPSSFECVLLKTSLDVLSQIRRVIFGHCLDHGFQNNTFGAV